MRVRSAPAARKSAWSQEVAAGLEGATWTLRTEVSERSDVLFDVGFVRRGRSVAQVTFLPAGRADLSDAEFRDLVLRAGERLGELG